MTEDITIAGTKGGKPIYRLPPESEPLTFMQKYLGESTFTALSLTAIVKVASVLALGLAAGDAEKVAEVAADSAVGAESAGDAFSHVTAASEVATENSTTLNNMASGAKDPVTKELLTKPSYGAARSAGAGVLGSIGAAVKGLNFASSMGVISAAGVGGALLNKHQVEKKAAAGVEIAPPSRLNAGVFRGALGGFVMGAGLPMAGLTILGFFIPAIPAVAGTVALGLVGVGTVVSVYSAHKKGKEHYAKAEKDYNSIKELYEVQEGIRPSPAKARTKDAAKEIAKAATIGAVGAGATVDTPEMGAAAAVGTAVGMDEAPQEKWHPAQDKAEGHSFAAQIMAERESKMLGDAAKEIAGTFMGTR